MKAISGNRLEYNAIRSHIGNHRNPCDVKGTSYCTFPPSFRHIAKGRRKMPDKAKLNFIIDALMFICMTAIVGFGILMKFILIPGKERWAKYGGSVEILWLGMDRHEWGTIHLSLGFMLLGLLALHIVLHWKVIVGIFHKMVSNQKARQLIAPAFVVASLLLLIAPLAVKSEIQEKERGRHSLTGPEENNLGRVGCLQDVPYYTGHRADGPMEIRGFMTLAEVSEKCNVPTQCLKTHLGIPVSVPDTKKLGRLKKNYNFTMSDVERVIARYLDNH